MTWLELNEEWGALIAPNATYEVNSPVWSWLFSQSLSGTRIPPCQLSWLLQLYIYIQSFIFSHAANGQKLNSLILSFCEKELFGCV